MPPHHWLRPVLRFLQDHSLTIFLVLTGAAWIWLFAASSPNSKWGQVVGNIVSEWTQIFGMVLLTKRCWKLTPRKAGRNELSAGTLAC